MIEVERFDVNSEEQRPLGRPRVASFRAEKRGAIVVRVQRDDGSLWLWAQGPKGGDRGRLALGLKRAGDVLEFADSIKATDRRYGSGPSLGGGDYRLSVRRPWRDRAVDWITTDRLVHVAKGHSMDSFALRFEAPALDELALLLREWARAAIAQDPAAYLPTREQILSEHSRAVLLAGRAEMAQDARMAEELRAAADALARAAGPEVPELPVRSQAQTPGA